MKVKITLELDASEEPKAAELIALVQNFADAKVTVLPVAGGGGTAAAPSEEERARFRERCATLLAQLGQVSGEEGDAGAQAAMVEAQTRVCALLEEAPYAGELVAEDFFAVFAETAFAVERVKQGLSVVPFMALLPRLPEPLRADVRTRVLQTVVDHLNQKRPVDANRMDFFAYAEAFAALVKLEFVNINAAITAIVTLLIRPETRCAGVTMLGKTVELCLHLITGKGDPAKVAELRSALSLVKEDVFQYDVNYIEDNMSWGRSRQPAASAVLAGAAASSASAAAVAGAGGSRAAARAAAPVRSMRAVGEQLVGRFVCAGRLEGSSDTLYTLSFDHGHGVLLGGSRDGVIAGWDTEGRALGRLELPRLYACATDINPRTKSFYVCGVPRAQQTKPAAAPGLLLYSLEGLDRQQRPGGGARPAEAALNCRFRGVLGSEVYREERVISCVEALVQDQGSHFATGESLAGSQAGCVRVYDEEAASVERLQPLVSYTEHESFVTALAHHPSAEGVLFSGSRDGSIKMWDVRQPTSAATVGMLHPAVAQARAELKIQQQLPMVTSIHAHGCVLASGSVDSSMRLWDLRKLGAPRFQTMVDGAAILKMAISPLTTSSFPIVAISTNRNEGLYMAFPAIRTINASEPRPAAAADPCKFYDLAWGERDEAGDPLLYAAGTELRAYVTEWED